MAEECELSQQQLIVLSKQVRRALADSAFGCLRLQWWYLRALQQPIRGVSNGQQFDPCRLALREARRHYSMSPGDALNLPKNRQLPVAGREGNLKHHEPFGSQSAHFPRGLISSLSLE